MATATSIGEVVCYLESQWYPFALFGVLGSSIQYTNREKGHVYCNKITGLPRLSGSCSRGGSQWLRCPVSWSSCLRFPRADLWLCWGGRRTGPSLSMCLCFLCDTKPQILRCSFVLQFWTQRTSSKYADNAHSSIRLRGDLRFGTYRSTDALRNGAEVARYALGTSAFKGRSQFAFSFGEGLFQREEQIWLLQVRQA